VIKNGFADAGICTSAVARTEGLRFVPLAREDYEFVLRREMLGDLRIQALITGIRSDPFVQALEKTGAYDTSLTGTLRTITPEKILAP
jgi:putative molybdopterin biosynthesis protein